MENKDHLSVFGVESYFIFPTIIIAILSLVLSFYGLIPKYALNQISILIVFCVILIILGLYSTYLLLLNQKFIIILKENKLITTNIYSYVRHPIYSATAYITTGLILIS